MKHVAKDKSIVKQLEKVALRLSSKGNFFSLSKIHLTRLKCVQSRTQASPNLEQERQDRDREEVQRRRQEQTETVRLT